MKYNNIKYSVLALLLTLGAMTSCVDDDIVLCEKEDYETPFTDGYAINLAVTIDKMGGTRATEAKEKELEEIENYIDPEKFRVLFFDEKDKFLFESKSRWIKQLTPVGAENSQWLVSVPLYTYGNDEEYNWDWEAIREALTKGPFKIAILANRPGTDYCPQFDNTSYATATDFDNSGPHWGAEETIWYAKKRGTTPKDIFDLHHSQFDPVYSAKSWDKDYTAEEEGFYDFISERRDGKRELIMSSTSSWVDYEDGDTRKDPNGWRYYIHPSVNHPIPMYGVQKFDKITGWIKGTPFNLSNLTGRDPSGSYNYNSISLLRSVVKLEFKLKKSAAYTLDNLFLCYSNIYARCEPMDVWTPTDMLWEGENHEGKGHNYNEDCDWFKIKEYGPISRNTDTKKSSTVMDYTRRLSWLYGSWLEKDWKFGNLGQDRVKNVLAQYGSSPRIFNPYIQRNNLVNCEKVKMPENEEYYHYVVYTGERNVNDPSKLFNLGDNTSGAATIIYWGLVLKDNSVNNKYILYNIPLTNYNSSEDANKIIDKRDDIQKSGNKYQWYKTNSWADGLPTGIQTYENLVQDVNDQTPKPWPLMRNHIYRTTVSLADSYILDFTKPISSETAYNMYMDSKWTKPWGKETVILEYSKLKNNTPGSAEVDWWSEKTTTLTRSSGEPFKEHANKIKVNGTDYTPIETGKGDNGANDRQTTLTLPDDKLAEKITLCSYVYKTRGFSANLTTTSSITLNSGASREITTSDATVSGGTMSVTNNHTGTETVVNGKNFVINRNAIYFKVELTEALAVGDVISATIVGRDDVIAGICITQEPLDPNAERDNIPVIKARQTAGAQNKLSYTVSADDGLVGATTIYLNRYTGKGTEFNNLIINPAATNTYWNEVAGVNYEKDRTNMFALPGDKNIDIYTFTFPATNKVTFTGGGPEQICYVASVDVKDKNNTTDYWSMSLSDKTDEKEMKANDTNIYELGSLQFSKKGTVYIYDTNPSKVRFTGGTEISLPNLKKDYIVTFVGQSTESGSITAGSSLEFIADDSSPQTNGACIFAGNEESTFKWKVKNAGNAKFTLSDEAIDLYMVRVDAPYSSSGARSTRSAGSAGCGFSVNSENLYSKSLKVN